MRRLTTLGVLSLTAAVAAACDEGRTSTLEPFGPIAVGTPIGAAAAGVPTGTVTFAIRTTIDTSQTPDDTLSVDSLVIVRVRNLRPTSAGSYQVWLTAIDTTTGLPSIAAASGRLVERFMRDSLDGGNQVPDPITGDPIRLPDSTVVGMGEQVYAGSDNPDVFAADFELRPGASSVEPFTAHAVTVSIEPTAGAAPTGAQVLWRRVGLGIGAATPTSTRFPDLTDSTTIEVTTSRAGGGTIAFGVFSGPDEAGLTSAADYVYLPGGTGVMNFRGPEAAADFRELPRPPVGYFYRGYLVDTAGTVVMVDTLRSAYAPVESQSRVSLYNADVNGLLPGIAVTAITHSQVRNCAGDVIPTCRNTLDLPAAGTFNGQARFILTLDPKGAGGGLGMTVILAGDIPDRVWED